MEEPAAKKARRDASYLFWCDLRRRPGGAIRAMLVSKVNPIAGVGPRLAPGLAPELGIR